MSVHRFPNCTSYFLELLFVKIPVTVATAERSISKLKLIKMYEDVFEIKVVPGKA